MRKEVMEFVQGCADCQRHKVNNRPIKAALQPIYPKPEALPFETIVLDFITKLPVSQGSDTILTITDHDCTKAAVFIPCREEISAEETAALYLKHVFLRYGLPSKIISDHDPRFTSKFTREVCKTLGISQNISTAYHPRTDGQSERSNQWVEQYLRCYDPDASVTSPCLVLFRLCPLSSLTPIKRSFCFLFRVQRTLTAFPVVLHCFVLLASLCLLSSI